MNVRNITINGSTTDSFAQSKRLVTAQGQSSKNSRPNYGNVSASAAFATITVRSAVIFCSLLQVERGAIMLC